MLDINISKLTDKFKSITNKKLQDLVSVDFDAAGVNCVRMRKTGDNVSVTAADVLPAVDIGMDSARAVETGASFSLPRNLIARYVSICIPADNAIVKLLNLPGGFNSDNEEQIRGLMGIEKENRRIGYRMVNEGHGRSETKMLTVAIPEAQAQAACAMFPYGLPAPMSMETAGLAVLTAFFYSTVQNNPDDAIGIIGCSARNTFIAFFFKKELALIRKFDFGTYHLLDTIQQSLGVDRETALDVMADNSFDISQLIKEVSGPFIKQLVISKDFVERREDCHILKVFVPGETRVSHDWLNEVKSALGVDVDFWNPLEGLTVAPNAFPKKYENQLSRFSAAVGSGLGSFEENE